MTAEEIESYLTKYGEDIFRFCCFLTGSKEQAEDLYQDTFLTCMELHKEIAPEAAKKFLIGIAANLWKNKWRKEKRRQKIITPVDFTDDEMSLQTTKYAAASKDLLDSYIDQEMSRMIQQAVNALPEKYRIIVLLYYSADLSTREIAEQLHISKGTVTSRLLRARERIKKGLEASGYEGL